MSVTGTTVGPETGVARSRLSGRNTLIGASSGDVIGFQFTVVIDVMVWAGASGCMSRSSIAADCAMICCGQDVSPDDMIETVYVINSRNRLQTKLFIYHLYSVPVADVNRRLTLFIGSPLVIWAAKVYVCWVW